MGVSFGPGDGTLAESPTLVDIDPYVVQWTTDRGRQSEFERTEAGTSEVSLQDRDGPFDPTNASSPYYGQLLPLRQSKIDFVHPIAGSTHDIFTGYFEGLSYKREGPRGAKTTAALTDGFEVINAAHLTFNSAAGAWYAPQHVDDRIKAVLEDIGWPSSLTRIATGNVNVQAIGYDAGTGALEAIQDAADAEFPGVANFFIDKSGNAAFSGRQIRFDPDTYPDWITTWAVGDEGAIALDPTLLPIFDMSSSIGKEVLYNSVTAFPRGLDAKGIKAAYPGGGEHDSDSITAYGRRSLTLPDLLTLDGSTTGNSGVDECKAFAIYYLANYKVPHVRVTELVFHGQMDDGNSPLAGALWDFILGVDLNHIVTINTVHPGGGGIAGVDYFVEGIRNEVSNLNDTIPSWTMTLSLSPRALYTTPITVIL